MQVRLPYTVLPDAAASVLANPHDGILFIRLTVDKSPPSQQAIIEFMLQQPLDFDPGERSAYSNFGYCVLGRVIEAATAKTYEAYVQEHVLKPIDVVDMQIGRSLPEQRAAGEVVYYDALQREGAPMRAPDRMVPRPYLIDHEVMDSHGAWIASAIDLVKFADGLNDPANSPLLSEVAIETMFARPPGDDGAAYYACGWNVRPVGDSMNTWHGGLINGTSTLLVRRHDGLNWAVLFNTNTTARPGRTPGALIDGMMHEAARAVTAWPEPGE